LPKQQKISKFPTFQQHFIVSYNVRLASSYHHKQQGSCRSELQSFHHQSVMTAPCSVPPSCYLH